MDDEKQHTRPLAHRPHSTYLRTDLLSIYVLTYANAYAYAYARSYAYIDLFELIELIKLRHDYLSISLSLYLSVPMCHGYHIEGGLLSSGALESQCWFSSIVSYNIQHH